MSTDEYVPSEDEMRHAYWLTRMLDHYAAVDAAFDRFLARVRRDAWEEGAQHGSRSPGYYPDENPYGYEEAP